MEREQINEHSCEKEQAIVGALYSGTLEPELLAHAASCPVCSDVLLVADNLQKDSVSLESVLHVPDAAVIWKRAQTQAKEQAIAKAMLPIRVARVCTCVFAFVAALRLVVEVSNHPTWLADLGLRNSPATESWLAAFNGTTTAGLAAAIVFLGLSSWYMLRQN
jgi:hypothetical protein